MSDTTKRISTIFTIKNDEFNRSLTDMNKQIKLTESELKLAGSSLKEFGSNTKNLSDKQKGLETQIKNIQEKMKLYNESVQKNTSSLEKNRKELDDLKQKKSDLNAKLKESIKLNGEESEETKKIRAELNKTNDEYKKKEQQIKNNVNAVNKHTVELNKNEAQLNKLQGELSKTNAELDKSNNKWLNASEHLEKNSQRLKAAGSTINGLGDNILKLSAPLVAAGVAGTKFAMDFETSVAKMSTIADENEVSIDDMRKGILKLSNDTGIASTEIADNVYNAISAGQKTGDALNFVTNSTKLAKAGFAEAGNALDVLTTIMNSYGLKAKEVNRVSDVLINTQNLGKTTVAELSSSMGKIIPTANSLGINLEQVATGYAQMTAKGVATAETTTYMNSMFNELGKSGTKASDAVKELSGKSFQDLISEGSTVGDVLAKLNQYAIDNGKSLADMFGSAEAGKAALILSTNAGKDFNDVLGKMQNCSGATDEAFKKVSDTTENRLKKNLNELKNEGIRLGTALMPVLEKGIDILGKVTDEISKLSDEQLENIAKWGMMTVAAGGSLKVLGTGVSIAGNVVGGLGKLTSALSKTSKATTTIGTAASVAGGANGLGSLAASFGTVAVAAAPYLAVAGLVVVSGKVIHDEVTKEVVPSIDLFANKVTTTYKNVETAQGTMQSVAQQSTLVISEETKKQVQAFLELDNQAKMTIDNLFINSKTVTAENLAEITTQFQEMGNLVIQGIEKDKQEAITSLTQFFADSKTLSDTEEAAILTRQNQFYEDKKKIVNDKQTELLSIIQKAKDEHRSLTDAEMKDVNRIQEEMKTNAIKTLSENELEANAILERMKEYDGRITAEQAAEHIKTLNDSRDKAVETAQDEYKKRVAEIVKLRDEAGVISKDQADKLIKDAQRTRDDSIKAAEGTRTGAISKIREMYNQLDDEVDTRTGTILTKWERFKQWWSGWQPEPKILSVTEQRQQIILNNPERYSNTGNSGYATGTNYNNVAGIYEVNELGWELLDNQISTLSTNLAYVPQGARVTNHAQSVQAMRNDIKKEVESQTKNQQGKIIDELKEIFKDKNVGKIDLDLDINVNNNGNKEITTTDIDKHAEYISKVVSNRFNKIMRTVNLY